MITERVFIKMKDGPRIRGEVFETGAKKWIVVTHGIGEHLGRHQYFMKLFPENFNIFFYDLRGHGLSEGPRAKIKSFFRFREDLEEILDFLKNNYRMKNYVLFGHSMGAVISADYMQNLARPKFYPTKVFLSAPPVVPGGILGGILSSLKKPTNFMASLKFGLYLKGMVDLKNLSHDGRVIESYLNDELNSTKLHSRLLMGMVDASNRIFQRPLGINVPLACCCGSEDQVINVSSLKKYFSTVERKAKFKIIEGAFHEMHNEIVKYRRPYFFFLKKFINK